MTGVPADTPRDAITDPPGAVDTVDDLLLVEGLRAGFGEVQVVRDLDLRVGRGEMVAILGRNGAGKTTSLRTLAGTVASQGGTVQLAGRDVTGLGPERRVRLGLILVPEGRHLFADLTVQENLAMGGYHRRLRRRVLADEIERVTESLPRVRERLDQRAGTLSGGEQQMVAVARGLLADPSLLLIDEPSLGLAPIMVEAIYEVLQRLMTSGLTIVVVEQYADVALAAADRCVVIENGTSVLSGPAEEIAASRELVDAYLSTPEGADR
ncbi:ABC transporter ATP-binding protein [Iamia sp. SCSIO 61187]|uniref:ABC transporter ATP-binding protein n=1 Tax=Iamia sp. SCSIO 61187 TaxID=2722752 RepID=UPI001C62E410|nr:ABC transporter ATP-binding protein [Iamia sp. SCSIO 61187]QYG94492.1 ABC transporter ATP-binding protein [Iamia sp. SCSIO 61187]